MSDDVATNVKASDTTLKNGESCCSCNPTGTRYTTDGSRDTSMPISELESSYTDKFDDKDYYNYFDGGHP